MKTIAQFEWLLGRSRDVDPISTDSASLRGSPNGTSVTVHIKIWDGLDRTLLTKNRRFARTFHP
jgi:hypothetical protein